MWLSCQHRDEENKAAHEKPRRGRSPPAGFLRSAIIEQFGEGALVASRAGTRAPRLLPQSMRLLCGALGQALARLRVLNRRFLI